MFHLCLSVIPLSLFHCLSVLILSTSISFVSFWFPLSISPSVCLTLSLSALPTSVCLRVLEEASASQASSKKDSRVDLSGKNRTYDIRIENFDVSFGER